MSVAMIVLASAELIQGHAARARTLLEECLTISRAFGNRLGVSMAFDILGVLALQQGELSQAEAYLADSARLASEVGERRNIAHSRLQLANLAMKREEFGTARQLYEECLVTALDMGLTNYAASVYITSGLKGLGCVAAALGLPIWATLLWSTAELLREEMAAAYALDVPLVIDVRVGENWDEMTPLAAAATATAAS